MIPAAVRELTEAEALETRPSIQSRVIYRFPNGEWMVRPNIGSHIRDYATVYNNYNTDTPTGLARDMIVEILPDEVRAPAPATHRLPPAIRELTAREMHDYWEEHNDDEMLPPLLTCSFLLRAPDGRWRAAAEDYDVFTLSRDLAHVFYRYGSVSVGNYTEGIIFEILPLEGEVAAGYPVQPIQPIATGKLINKYFSADFMRMFIAAPKNDMVRGWILKITKQLPAEDCETPEKLEEWLQSIQGKTETLPPPKDVEVGVSVNVSFTGSESGTCRYMGYTTGGDQFVFSADDLRTLVTEADGDFDSLFEHAKEQLSDNVGDLEPDMSANEDGYDYDQYDQSEDNAIWDDFNYSSNQLRENLKTWIRNNMPEAVESLGL